jgi:hypothetical protein
MTPGPACWCPLVDEVEIQGPVRGGRHGSPFGASIEDLAALGYIEEEYFIAGMAPTYALAPDSAYTRDGRWSAEQSQMVPFRTRIVVRRPVNPARFNGTVVVEWNNVSMAHDLMLTDITGLAAAGFAFAGVSAQPLGIQGFGSSGLSLIGWDEDRYGTLNVPSENASYGVFSQVAQAVGPQRPLSPVDPMGALPVERLIATGASQSAQRLHTYINAVHPVAPVFDGFLPVVHIGIAAPLNAPEDHFMPYLDGDGQPLHADIFEVHPHVHYQIRDDLDTPVLVFNSESEARTFFPIRRPDDDRYRVWEVAGAAHGGDGTARAEPLLERDFGVGTPRAPMPELEELMANPNPTSWMPPLHAALHHLDRWIATSTPPPSTRPIEVDAQSGDIVRDEVGIARGGVRLPHVEAPTATLSGTAEHPAWLLSLGGRRIPFSDDALRALYPDHSTYVSRVAASADAAVAAGVLLPRDAAEMVEAAEMAPVPPG